MQIISAQAYLGDKRYTGGGGDILRFDCTEDKIPFPSYFNPISKR